MKQINKPFKLVLSENYNAYRTKVNPQMLFYHSGSKEELLSKSNST
jgi:hypothetical protein